MTTNRDSAAFGHLTNGSYSISPDTAKTSLLGVGCAVFSFIFFVALSPARSQVLTHGPVFGGVTSSAANVFVRTDQSATVYLEYGTDPTLTTYEQSASYTTSSDDDFTKIVPLTDLVPETKYYVNVVVDDVPQLTADNYGSFNSFPPEDSPRDFSFVCMSDFGTVKALTHSVSAFTSAALTNPAFVFIGGDFDHRQPTTLDLKRQMFKDLYDPATPFMDGFADLILHHFPIAHQWDDHDAGANNLDKTYSHWPDTQTAYQEYVPAYPLPSVSPGIWQRFTYAQMDAFVLDCRSQRDNENDPDDSNKSMLDGNNLGATGQLEWLENGLLNSTARWKVIFTSVVTNTSTKYPDGWAGYQTEWNALKNFINSNNITGVVFISGDLHLPAIDNGSEAGFPEMCVSQPNGAGGCPTARAGTWSEGYFLDGTCSGFNVVSISQDPDALTLEALDENGIVKLSYTVGETQTGAPVITVQPSDQTILAGQTGTFSVTATGTDPLTYQWFRNGRGIPEATSSDFVTPPVTLRQNGALFSVTVSNSAGNVVSRQALLTVTRKQASHSPGKETK